MHKIKKSYLILFVSFFVHFLLEVSLLLLLFHLIFISFILFSNVNKNSTELNLNETQQNISVPYILIKL